MKFLVVGPGLIGHKHIELIEQHKECSVEAIVTLHPANHKHYESELGASIYSDLNEALEHHHFDAAIISSPNEWHFEHAVQCIDENIPVLVEKPLTDDIEHARNLVEYAKQKNVPVLVGHHRTYSSLIPKAKDILTSTGFGKLVAFQGSALFYKPKHYFLDGEWRTKKGGGPILINLIHEIGIMRELCGEIEQVFAFASNSTRKFEVEDTVAISLKFVSGCLGTFLLSDCSASVKSWEMTSGENPAYPHFPEEACYHFAGSNGSLDFPSMCFTYYKNPEQASWWKPFEQETREVTADDPLKCQLDHFVNVVKGKESPIVTAQSGYKNMLVLEAIRQSILEEKTINLTQMV